MPNEDKSANRKLVSYEWHFGTNSINAIDDGPVREEWLKQFELFGFTLKSEKQIELEGFVLTRKIYSTKSSKKLAGIDPLALFSSGYLKADSERVVFEIDHSLKSKI